MTLLPYKRSERVSKVLQSEISKIILELKDPEIGFLTVTDVEITDDLSEAKIYYSVLGEEQEKQATAKVLCRAAGFIRHRLGENLNFRKVPEIKFIYDNTPATAARIFSILEKLNSEKRDVKTRRKR